MSSENTSPNPYAESMVFGPCLQILRTRQGMTCDQLGKLRAALAGDLVKRACQPALNM
ncbi:hypothetical protein [Streptomyces sp. NPDC059466]|uniref:hypothetical protein n=1 Tax=unclassified Streptomyces TaxID=2593676 RepID=UPI0036A3CBCB